MFRLTLISNLIKNKKVSSSSLSKYNKKFNSVDAEEINHQLFEMDKKIALTTKELFESQLIQIKLLFSSNKNWFKRIQSNIYQAPIEKSINWHRNQLILLYNERRKLQFEYEKITGTYWINRIKSFCSYLLSALLILFSCALFILGIMALIYILPVLLIIIIVYFLINSKAKVK